MQEPNRLTCIPVVGAVGIWQWTETQKAVRRFDIEKENGLIFFVPIEGSRCELPVEQYLCLSPQSFVAFFSLALPEPEARFETWLLIQDLTKS